MTKKKPLTCPLCNHIIDGTSSRRYQRGGSLKRVFTDTLEDIAAWAECDVLADDGHILQAVDLARYLANELVPPLMKIYMRQLGEQRRDFKTLQARVDKETAELRVIKSGVTIPRRGRGAPLKDTCKRGHPRTPDNVSNHGSCKTCDRLYAARPRAT